MASFFYNYIIFITIKNIDYFNDFTAFFWQGNNSATTTCWDCVTCHVLTNSNSILKRSIIEQIGRELAQRGVHAVLYLQTNRTDSQNHQAFKQRLRKTSTEEKIKKLYSQTLHNTH